MGELMPFVDVPELNGSGHTGLRHHSDLSSWHTLGLFVMAKTASIRISKHPHWKTVSIALGQVHMEWRSMIHAIAYTKLFVNSPVLSIP